MPAHAWHAYMHAVASDQRRVCVGPVGACACACPSWDYVFVYEGGLSGQQVGAYTGDAVPYLHWLVTSESLFVFRTDAEATGTGLGFSASYTISLCPNDCGGVGSCTGGVCTCPTGYSGDGCEVTACPSACNSATGNGACQDQQCVCSSDYKGTHASAVVVPPLPRRGRDCMAEWFFPAATPVPTAFGRVHHLRG